METRNISRRKAAGLASVGLLTGLLPCQSRAAWPLVVRGLCGLARACLGRIGAKEVLSSAVTPLVKRSLSRVVSASVPGTFARSSADLALKGVKAYEIFSTVSDAFSDTYYVLEHFSITGDLKFPLLKETSRNRDTDDINIITDVYVTADPLLLAILGNESHPLERVYENSKSEGRAVPESLDVFLRDMLFPINFKTFESFGFDRGAKCEFQSAYGNIKLTYNSTWTEEGVSGKYIIEVTSGKEMYGPIERHYKFLSA